MNYRAADINTRINTKGNTVIYYRRNPNRHLINRVKDKDTDIAFSRFGMMTQPEQFREPRNAGNPKY